MTQGEVISKLARECCLAMGEFYYYDTVRTYIQMALSIGIEHYTKDMEEIVALYQDGREAGRFKSVGEAATKLGLPQSSVSSVLSGKQYTAGGLKFVKTKDFELFKRDDNTSFRVPI